MESVPYKTRHQEASSLVHLLMSSCALSLPLSLPYEGTERRGLFQKPEDSSYQALIMLAPWSQTSYLQNCEEIHFWCVRHLIYSSFLWQPELINTATWGRITNEVVKYVTKTLGVAWSKMLVRHIQFFNSYLWSSLYMVGIVTRY